ncbi:hypothetical protein [Ligilactobacillus ruminis]|uniref:hypothetical protein n=1 Tax=Ligilactobacillus ruminis TaxID=1623 RepID=UPI0022E930EA|nr:hypothetical protein [Ligilactobacillus ruminis]
MKAWRAATFGKISAFYGHIDENGSSVRKWLARKMEITDKMVKNGRLSVNLSEILAKSVEQYCCLKKVVFIHWKLKVPDKFSRKSTGFVRLFV